MAGIQFIVPVRTCYTVGSAIFCASVSFAHGGFTRPGGRESFPSYEMK
jgi:hypothetical protein